MNVSLRTHKMAKKRTERPGQVSVVQLKGTPEWKEWFEKLVDHSRMPAAVLLDLALKDWAERNRFTDPPPKR